MAKILGDGDFLRVEKRVSGMGNQVSAILIYPDKVVIERVMTPDKPTIISYDRISYFFVSRYFVDNQNYNVILYDDKDNVIIDFRLDSRFSDGENNCVETRTLLNVFAQYKLGSDFYKKLDTINVKIPIKKDSISKSEILTLQNGVLTFPDNSSKKIEDVVNVVFFPDAVLPKIKVVFKDKSTFDIAATGSQAVLLFEAILRKNKGYGIDFTKRDPINKQEDSFMCRDKLIDDLVFDDIAQICQSIGNVIFDYKNGKIGKYLRKDESIKEEFIGNVDFPTGKIVVTDPKNLNQELSFAKSIPVGVYPAYIHVLSNNQKQLIAFAEIRVNNNPVQKYENALFETSVDNEELFEMTEIPSESISIMDRKYFEYMYEELCNDMIDDIEDKLYRDRKDSYNALIYEPEKGIKFFLFSNFDNGGNYPTYFGYDSTGSISSIVVYMDVVSYEEFAEIPS